MLTSNLRISSFELVSKKEPLTLSITYDRNGFKEVGIRSRLAENPGK
jgi:hypothetical protein